MSQTLDPAFPVRREPSETIKPAYQNVEAAEVLEPEKTSDNSSDREAPDPPPSSKT